MAYALGVVRRQSHKRGQGRRLLWETDNGIATARIRLRDYRADLDRSERE